MKALAVTAIQLGENGSPRYVIWGLLRAPGKWATLPHPADVMEVLDALRNGEDVFAVFGEGEQTVIGARLHIGVGGDGSERLVSLAENSGRGLSKLPQFSMHNKGAASAYEVSISADARQQKAGGHHALTSAAMGDIDLVGKRFVGTM